MRELAFLPALLVGFAIGCLFTIVALGEPEPEPLIFHDTPYGLIADDDPVRLCCDLPTMDAIDACLAEIPGYFEETE